MDPPQASLPPLLAGLACRCPRCGKGALYKSPWGLELRETCGDCGLDFRFVDTGDGPAVLAIMVLGFVMLGAALTLEFTLHPPLWVHVVLWTPVALVIALGLLRPMKALLVALQVHHRAGEGGLSKD